MSTRDTIFFLLAPLVLIITAALINSFQLWSFLGNYTVGWLCSALALALLIVAATARLAGTSPASIPRPGMLVAMTGTSAAVGIGMLIDSFAYGIPPDWPASIGEWIGFTLILGVSFWLPRVPPDSKLQQYAESSR